MRLPHVPVTQVVHERPHLKLEGDSGCEFSTPKDRIFKRLSSPSKNPLRHSPSRGLQHYSLKRVTNIDSQESSSRYTHKVQPKQVLKTRISLVTQTSACISDTWTVEDASPAGEH